MLHAAKFQIVGNKGISMENFSREALTLMLQDLFEKKKKNNHLNDALHCKVKDDIELSLIVSPRVRIRFAYVRYSMMKDVL